MLSAPIALGVAAGGALGALLRLSCIRLGARLLGSEPLGVTLGNTLATLAVGVILAAPREAWVLLCAVGGVAGGMGTLSTLCTILISKVNHGQPLAALCYLALNAALGMAAIWAGHGIGVALC
ncbi:MAG: CrcB family protein [Succinivibrionaceae bacterium]|nr:CrcB family protein [Succinivibrionaceae bacterium]